MWNHQFIYIRPSKYCWWELVHQFLRHFCPYFSMHICCFKLVYLLPITKGKILNNSLCPNCGYIAHSLFWTWDLKSHLDWKLNNLPKSLRLLSFNQNVANKHCICREHSICLILFAIGQVDTGEGLLRKLTVVLWKQTDMSLTQFVSFSTTRNMLLQNCFMLKAFKLHRVRVCACSNLVPF